MDRALEAENPFGLVFLGKTPGDLLQSIKLEKLNIYFFLRI